MGLLVSLYNVSIYGVYYQMGSKRILVFDPIFVYFVGIKALI